MFIKYVITWIMIWYIVNPHNIDDKKIIKTEHKEKIFYDCDSAYNWYQYVKYGKQTSRYYTDIEIDSVIMVIDTIKK